MQQMSRNLKKVFSILLAAALLIPSGWLASVAEAAEQTETIYHETFASGKGVATQSGGASLTQVTGKFFSGNDDGAALYVSNRANNWDAVDFKFSDIGLVNGKTYTITVKGYVDDGEIVPSGAQAFLQTVDSYSWLAGSNFVAGETFTLTGTYTAGSKENDKSIRVQSNDVGATVPFYIGDIFITTEKSTDTETEREVYHETFASGKGVATQSGGASLTPVTSKVFAGNDDGAALYVSNRVNNWDAVDFKFSDISLINGKTYTITVNGYVDVGETVPSGAQAFLQTVNSFGWLAGANFAAGSTFILTKEFTVDTSKDSAIRVQSNPEGATVPFYIGDILITEKVASGGEEEPPRPPALPFTAITFEDHTTGGFVGRAGTETLTITNEANHTENGSNALKIEGRASTWHGPSLRVEKYVDKGFEYKVTAWVKLISPASSQIQLSTQIGNGSSANYVSLAAKTISTNDGWVKYEGMYRYNNVGDEYLTIYVESNSSATASFYIDDISFESTGSGPTPIQKDLVPIKDAYKNDFLIGNAISAEDLDGVRLELLKMHHNVATAGNAMKPDALQPTKGNFTFTSSDAMVNKVLAEGMQMHGHTLVWHQQSPVWMNTANGAPLERSEALENLKTHIKTVVEHFGNKVISWDVVNEAMNDNPPNPANWKESLRKSPWYQAIGPDYLEQAFLAAREVLDEKGWDIKLYYNDYNDDNQNKALAIYNMVKEINDNYALTHPGQLLIDGIGMQGHYSINTSPANVERSLEKFISLGVEVSITELDIQAGSNYQLTEKQAIDQGYLYAQLMDIYKAHAQNIARVTWWGLDDGTSWRASANPLLFDKNLQAKLAYYGVIDPIKYLNDHKPEVKEALQSSAKYGTPDIDGVPDLIWNDAPAMPINRYQMAWQGASGTAKALWDDHYLYVLIQVNDAQLDKKSANPWEQDSVEVFLDENNAKTTFYQVDDGQYRVNFDNETSFNPASIAAGFVSATKVSGTNYNVEMKIPLKTITPANNVKIGFDAQINDGKDGVRQSVAAWNDTTGTGYQDTSVFGILTLIGKDDPTPTDQDKVTAIVDADGHGRATVTADNMKKALSSVKAGAIVLKVYGADNAKQVTVTIPMDQLNAAKNAGVKRIEIASNIAMIDLPVTLLNSGDVVLNVGTIDPKTLPQDMQAKVGSNTVYDFNLIVGGKKISDLGPGQPVRVTVPYTLKPKESPGQIVICYLADNGKLEVVKNGSYDKKTGMLEFNAKHFD